MAKKRTDGETTDADVKKVAIPLPTDLHSDLKLTAIGHGISLNDLIVKILRTEGPKLRAELLKRLAADNGGPLFNQPAHQNDEAATV